MKFTFRDTLSSDLPYGTPIRGIGKTVVEISEVEDAKMFDHAIRELFQANNYDIGGIDLLEQPSGEQIDYIVTISNSGSQTLVLILNNGGVTVKAGLSDLFTVERRPDRYYAQMIEKFLYKTDEYEQTGDSRLNFIRDTRRATEDNLTKMLAVKATTGELADFFSDRCHEFDEGTESYRKAYELARFLTTIYRIL